MSELQTGSLLQGGKYKIEKSLGQGGFGITYLAEQTNLGRKVCIKEFFMKEYGERTAAPEEDSQETVLTGGGHPSGQTPKDNDATVLTGVSAVTSTAAAIMGRYREKFVKEARTIARLDHPGIVRIHDVFEENGTAYYVMDFIEGENLNDLVKREGALPEERALGYIRQVADALSYVHGHNIMHLDVKPANIIVRKSDDKAILIDFGTAKQYDSEGTQTSTTPVGLSVGYAPIEMTKPGGVQTFSPETDVYSLGATLYYLVTGQNPPDASERMEMIMEGEKFQLPESISSSTIEVIEQSMQARKKRIQNVNGFLELLNSDGEKRRLEAEEKAAKEAEAKRQENLRLEREKEDAEKKRIAEEKAIEEAEAKRQEALRKEEERLESEKKRIVEKKAQNKKTMRWALGGLVAIVSVVAIIAISNRPSYSESNNNNNEILAGLIEQINRSIENKEDPSTTLSLIKRAKELDPMNASLYYVEGNLNKNLGRIDEAIRCYEQSSKVDPNYEWGYFSMGSLYYELALELQEEADALPISEWKKYDELIAKMSNYLKKCVDPFEMAFSLTANEEVKLSSAEYLMNACKFFHEDNVYRGKYEKYQSYYNAH